MTDGDWVKLAPVTDCPPGRAKFVAVGGRRLAVFHLTAPDRFVVTADDCPHAGASLAAGEVHGHTVTCHWHAWMFDLDTGHCPTAEHACLQCYESREKDDYIWAKLP